MTVVLTEELARCRSGGVAFSVIVHTDMSSPWLGRDGSDDQKKRYLSDITSGRKVCALAITEPGRRLRYGLPRDASGMGMGTTGS